MVGGALTGHPFAPYEMTHYMRHKKKGKLGYVAVMLDMSKVYNRVEWIFLHDMMVKMGFNTRWIALIMKLLH